MRGDRPGGPIRWRLHLAVPPEQVYGALDSDEGRAAFWAESAKEKDGYIKFHFINDYQYKSKVMRREPPSLFELEYFGGVARFEMLPDDNGGTDLLLTHENMGDDVWNEVHAGWLNVLFPLKAWLLRGVDLRNHDPKRTWDQGYADQ